MVTWFCSLDAAEAAAERIRREIEDGEVAAGDRSIQVTISCGVAALRPEQHQDLDTAAETLLVAADNALLQAKTQGRNQVVRALPPEPGPGFDTGSGHQELPGVP